MIPPTPLLWFGEPKFLKPEAPTSDMESHGRHGLFSDLLAHVWLLVSGLRMAYISMLFLTQMGERRHRNSSYDDSSMQVSLRKWMYVESSMCKWYN